MKRESSQRKRKNATETVSSERDQFTVVLESLRSDFRVFGEALGLLGVKVDSIDTRLIRVEDRLERVEIKVDYLEERVGGLESKLSKVESKVSHIENSMVTRSDMRVFDTRLTLLESQ